MSGENPGNLGNLIYSLRKKNNMSASKLSEGICTQKYIYMIENSERHPSVEILHKIFQRLKFDYFKYLQYIEMPHALEVTQVVSLIDQCRDFGDYGCIASMLPKLEKLNDGSLDGQIAYNRILVGLMDDWSYERVLEEAYEALGISDFKGFDRGCIGDYSLYELYLFNLIGEALFRNGDNSESMHIIRRIHDYFSYADPYQEYDQFIADNTISYARILHRAGRLEEALELLVNCEIRQTKSMISYKRHQLYYYIARIHMEMMRFDKAKEAAIVARYFCEQIDNSVFLLRVEKLIEDIDVKDRRSEARDGNIVVLDRKEIYLEQYDERATVQIFEPDIVHIFFNSFSLPLLSEVNHVADQMMKKHLKQVEAIHEIYDVRKLLIDTVRLNIQTLSATEGTGHLFKKKRKSIIRLENNLTVNNHIIDMYFSPYEHITGADPLIFRGKAKNLNQAMAIIKAIG